MEWLSCVFFLVTGLRALHAYTNFADVQCGRSPEELLESDYITPGTHIISNIQGGVSTDRAEFPWMTSLQIPTQHFCGGSIINDRWVLTAAHCVNNYQVIFKPEEIQVVFRKGYQRNARNQSNVTKIVVHPEYETGRMSVNDIALIELMSPIKWTDTVRPICFPADNSESFAGWKATAAGWGRTYVNETEPSLLRKVTAWIISNSECSEEHRGRHVMLDNHLCAGTYEGSDGIARGDSGGPLMVRDWKENVILNVGVLSGSFGYEAPRIADTYMRTSYYLEWIKDTITS